MFYRSMLVFFSYINLCFRLL